MPSFEERVQDLCKQVTACETDTEAVELVRQLQLVLHERIEHLRGNLRTLPLVSNPLDKLTT